MNGLLGDLVRVESPAEYLWPLSDPRSSALIRGSTPSVFDPCSIRSPWFHLAPHRLEVVLAHLLIELSHPLGFFGRELQRLDRRDPGFPIRKAGRVIPPFGLVDPD